MSMPTEKHRSTHTDLSIYMRTCKHVEQHVHAPKGTVPQVVELAGTENNSNSANI